jgi:hypothetical protein
MLRILVISLFVANLLLFAFQDSNESAAPVEAGVTKTNVDDPRIPTIHLFSEMVQDQGLMTGNRQCFSLGPFHTVEDTDEVYGRLLEVSVNISERQTHALVEKGYWVFMPPYVSLLEANQALLSLQALGLKDIAVIYDGEWKSAISLGYFLRQENAIRRKKTLVDRGHAPLIRVQRQSELRYWLDYEQNPGSGLIALDMQNRPNDFMQRSLPCPEQELFDAPPVESQAAISDVEQALEPEQDADVLPPGQDIDSSAAEGVENPGTANQEVALDQNANTDPNQSLETEPVEIEPETGSGDEVQAPEPEDDDDVLPPDQDAGTDAVEIAVNPDSQSLETEVSQSAITDPVQGVEAEVVETEPETDNSEEALALKIEQGDGDLPPAQDAGTDAEEIVESALDDNLETDPAQSMESETEQNADSGGETQVLEPEKEDDLMSLVQDAGTEVGEIIESSPKSSVGTGPSISIETAPAGTEKETDDDDGVDGG